MKSKPNYPMIIDGLLICKWSREIFQKMHQGGLTTANCTAAMPYANIQDSLKSAAQFHKWLFEFNDIIRPVGSTDDIWAAYQEKKVGIILGWQNTSGYDDYLPYIRLFRKLGLSIVQLTYNTMNSLGSGCLEPKDSGLSGFGYEFVEECNAAGVAIDLSHVGELTADNVITHSIKPVAYTHISPKALFDHARNKSNKQMKKIADKGGIVGVTMHPPFQLKGNQSTLDDYINSIEHCINVVGEDQVAIGTDFITGYQHDTPEWDYLLRDKGYARKLWEIGEIKYPPNFSSVADYQNLFKAMESHNWKSTRIEKILGMNWIEFLKKAWGE